MVSGDFAVRFGWSEGNDDTGKQLTTVRQFAIELSRWLVENGAWGVDVYGPDGDRVGLGDEEAQGSVEGVTRNVWDQGGIFN